jgi:hypothetical protein
MSTKMGNWFEKSLGSRGFSDEAFVRSPAASGADETAMGLEGIARISLINEDCHGQFDSAFECSDTQQQSDLATHGLLY